MIGCFYLFLVCICICVCVFILLFILFSLTSMSFLNARVYRKGINRSEVKEVENKGDTAWEQEVSHKLCLMSNKFIKKCMYDTLFAEGESVSRNQFSNADKKNTGCLRLSTGSLGAYNHGPSGQRARFPWLLQDLLKHQNRPCQVDLWQEHKTSTSKKVLDGRRRVLNHS